MAHNGFSSPVQGTNAEALAKACQSMREWLAAGERRGQASTRLNLTPDKRSETGFVPWSTPEFNSASRGDAKQNGTSEKDDPVMNNNKAPSAETPPAKPAAELLASSADTQRYKETPQTSEGSDPVLNDLPKQTGGWHKPERLRRHQASPEAVPCSEQSPRSLRAIEDALGVAHQDGAKAKKSERSWSVSSINSSEAEGMQVLPTQQAPSIESHTDVEPQQGFVDADKGIARWVMRSPTSPNASERNGTTETAMVVYRGPPQVMQNIDYPETYKCLHEGPIRDHRDIAWRQLNMTSELQIRREMKARKDLADRLRKKNLRQKARALHAEEEEQQQQAPQEEEAWPQADCMIRPAQPEDFEEIAGIINCEQQHEACPQIIGEERTTAADVWEIYQQSLINLRPFVVAIQQKENLSDPNKWPKGSKTAYLEYMRFRETQAEPPARIVGFAFIAETRVGFFNRPCPGSRFTGTIRVVVDPAHRRKLYGTALLDRVLLCVNPYHTSKIDHEWKCLKAGDVYQHPAAKNRRQYLCLTLEAFSESKDSQSFVAVKKMVEKFGFNLSSYASRVVRTDRYYQSRWLDLAKWELGVHGASDIIDQPPGHHLAA